MGMNRADIIRMAMNEDGHMNDYPGGMNMSWDVLVNVVYQAIAVEREACAQICKDFHKASEYPGFVDCADAIRARE
jgi:hypothetical protein